MDDKDYHELMADLYKQQREPKEAKPDGMPDNLWKNRYLISAKLNEALYADFFVWCKQHGYSINTGIKQILSEKFNHV